MSMSILGLMYMPNFKERKEKIVKQGVYLEDDNVPILEARKMKTKDKMCLGQNVFY